MYICNLVGANHRPPEAREAIKALPAHTELVLQREPTNPYDQFAIQVRDPNGDRLFGYVPKHIAAELAPKMDKGIRHACFVKRVNDIKPELWVDRMDSREWLKISASIPAGRILAGG
jgi:hypothetical protein